MRIAPADLDNKDHGRDLVMLVNEYAKDPLGNGEPLPDEIRADLLLEVDPRGLAAWLQMQTPEWRQAFVRELSGPLQTAIAANTITSSRADQLRWAQRGHRALVGALKQAYDKKGVRFAELVA